MKIKALLFILFAVLALACGLTVGKHKDHLIGARLTWTIPLIDTAKDEIAIINGSNDIYFYGNIAIYKKMDIRINQNKEEEVYSYWIYENHQKSGLFYDTLFPDKKGIKFDVDSFRIENTFSGFSENLIDKERDVLVSSEKIGDTFVEKYVSKLKLDSSYPDTTILYYDERLNGIPFSFSEELDSLKKAKLFKIRGVFNRRANSKFKSELKPREMLVEIKNKSVESSNKILSILERFKSEIKND